MNVIVCGPNLIDQSKGQFHVHTAGCADLTRSNEPSYYSGWPIEAQSKVEVVEWIYEDIIAENPGHKATDHAYMSDVHFFPCTAELPLGES
jgi:hypothetical protein